MKLLKTKVQINATPEKVWSILTNFDQYPNWNPFIKRATGNLEINDKLKVWIAPPNAKKMVFKPTVISVIENYELSWLGRFMLPGIFDGKHIFTIIKNDEGCLLIQKEYFSGLLVPFVWKSMEKNTKEGFEIMNHALKQRAEKEYYVKDF